MNLHDSLYFLTDQLLKGVVILGLAILVEMFCRRWSAASRGLLLLCAVMALALLPVTRLIRPQWVWGSGAAEPAAGNREMEIVRVTGVITPTAGHASGLPSAARSWPDWRALLLGMWVTGAALRLCLLAHGRSRLRKLYSGSRAVVGGRLGEILAEVSSRADGRWVSLRLSEDCQVPMTWGIARPVIVLPMGAEEWAPERMQIVLRHELAHIGRRDAAARLLAQVVCALHWCDPLIWVAARRLRLAQEQACDDLVLGAGTEPVAYADELLESVRRLRPGTLPWGEALAMAQPSTLHQRIGAILDGGRDRSGSDRRALPAAMGVLIVCLVGSAVAQVGPAVKKEEPPAAGNGSQLDSQSPIEFAAIFIEFPTEGVPAILSKALAEGRAQGYGILAPGLETAAWQAVRQMPGVNILSAPRLRANPGQTGTIEIGAGDKSSPAVHCTLSAVYRPAANGVEIQMTASASVRLPRRGEVEPFTQKGADQIELKPTVATLPLDGTALFRLPTATGATKTVLVLITAKKAPKATPSAPTASEEVHPAAPSTETPPADLNKQLQGDPTNATPNGELSDAEFSSHPMEINAQETRFEGGMAVAVGNVALTYRNLTIRGDEVRYDPSLRIVKASGNVILTQPPNSIQTEALEYRFRTGEVMTTGRTKTVIKGEAGGAPASK